MAALTATWGAHHAPAISFFFFFCSSIFSSLFFFPPLTAVNKIHLRPTNKTHNPLWAGIYKPFMLVHNLSQIHYTSTLLACCVQLRLKRGYSMRHTTCHKFITHHRLVSTASFETRMDMACATCTPQLNRTPI